MGKRRERRRGGAWLVQDEGDVVAREEGRRIRCW
jgi:hypothetical protein